jgi:DNA primase small subunit
MDASAFPFLMQQYYGRVFPFSKYFQWLSYGLPLSKYFQRREFSFTLKDDVYVRYQDFQDQAEMEQST